MSPWTRRLLRGAVWIVLAVALSLAALLAAALHLVRPAGTEWAETVRVGPVQQEVSVAALWRVASHPMALQLGAGRDWATPFGPVRWRAGGTDGEWAGTCSPCRIARPEWGGQAVVLSAVSFTLTRAADGQVHGTMAFGEGPRAVRGRWQLAVRPSGAALTLSVADVPMADGYHLLGPLVPETRRVRIDGRFDMEATLQWPSRALAVVPKVRGFRVEGLGTEALAGATSACGAAPVASHGVWLPRAVVAAEDQRFFEHAGFDLGEMQAAWALNGSRGDVVRGGSTLSQQVAKLLFTGADRSPARKLRELLYAVELDRTLGKARLLSLYLSIAPWGEGRCGAAAASRHYLHKEPADLAPIEAAWLASLLHAPDRERGAMARLGRVNVQRVDWVMSQMRPQPARRLRVGAEKWMPPNGGTFATR